MADFLCRNFTVLVLESCVTFLSISLYQEYEADKKRRLGEEGAKPKRIRYKPVTR